MNGDVWIISLISEEWEDISSNTWSIIVSELCKRWKFRPVVLLVITVYIEVLLEGLVYAFGLSIIFMIIA